MPRVSARCRLSNRKRNNGGGRNLSGVKRQRSVSEQTHLIQPLLIEALSPAGDRADSMALDVVGAADARSRRCRSSSRSRRSGDARRSEQQAKARPRRRRARCLRAGAGPFPGGACSRRGGEGPLPNGPAHSSPSFMLQVQLQVAKHVKHAKSQRQGGPWDQNALRSLLFGFWAQSAAVATGPIRVDGFSHRAIL